MPASRVALVATTAALLLATWMACAASAAERDLAIVDVSVIECDSGSKLPHQTILVGGDTILAIGPNASVTPPPGTRIVPAAGSFVIPGLWDMHVHTGSRAFLTLDVLAGVLGVRDMGGVDSDAGAPGILSAPFDSIRSWRRDIGERRLLGPHIVACGYALDGPDAVLSSLPIRDPATGRARVDSLANEGVDFIKVLTGLSSESYRAVAEAAAARGLDLVGHVPRGLTARDVAAAGQRSIEHLMGMPSDCFGAAHRPDAAAATACDSTLLELRAKGVYIVPTLVAWRGALLSFDRTVFDRADLAFVSPALRRRWAGRAPPATTAADQADARRTFGSFSALVRRARDAGVPIMAGSDCANAYVVPGFSLLDELELLVTAGLTPREALCAATVTPARFLRMTNSTGMIAAGKRADLVLLLANPLDDIRALRRIRALVVAGRYVSAEERRRLLARLGARAQGAHPTPR